MKNLFLVLGIMIAGLTFIFALSFFDYGMTNFFAPKYRAVDNKVFKQSEQYNDGMVRDLEDLQMEYLRADVAHQEALRAIILHRFSVYPEEKMPVNLQNFYEQLRDGK